MIMAGLFMLCGLLNPITAPAGDTVYIADVLTIGLRQSPDPKSSIIKALHSDAALEILEERDKYLRVRTATGDEGWIPKQHVSAQTPKSQTITALKTELAALKAKVQPARDATTNATAEIQALQSQYDKVKAELDQLQSQAGTDQSAMGQQFAEMTTRYNTLREQATHVDELGQELESLRAANTKLANDLEIQKQASSHLKRTDMIPWFLAGAGVFLAGFTIARLSPGRKKKSFY